MYYISRVKGKGVFRVYGLNIIIIIKYMFQHIQYDMQINIKIRMKLWLIYIFS